MNATDSRSGSAALAYGTAAYGLFLSVFFYTVGFIGDFFTPTRLDGVPGRPWLQALAIDLALLGLFAVQDSVMARPAFKRWRTRFIPEAVERSTYVLFSSVALLTLFAFWEPIGGVIWDAHGPARTVIIAVYLLGWALLLYSTFLIDHFDLFGLRQVWRRALGQPYQPPQFHTPGLYKSVRHPIYIGCLTIFWAAPTMTVAHLVFAVAATAYVLIAIRLEERDLVTAFGEPYLAYRRSTPMLIPRLHRETARPAATEVLKS
jgi:protein-S-isoprenylcysteine O-methyltransferase Ste14